MSLATISASRWNSVDLSEIKYPSAKVVSRAARVAASRPDDVLHAGWP
ncbi:MAG: hypothetical protein Q6365_018995 [Candidatus Sigynarchaeota archaeon]